MGQSVFLLFDSSARLERVTCAATNHGAVDPLSIFFAKPEDAEGYSALELDPRITEKIRPEVWVALNGHATRQGGELHVDPLEPIQGRLLATSIANADLRVLEVATRIGALEGASKILGELPPIGERRAEQYAAELEEARKIARELRERDPSSVVVGRILADLSGKRLPVR